MSMPEKGTSSSTDERFDIGWSRIRCRTILCHARTQRDRSVAASIS
jgi:hypothetical protein